MMRREMERNEPPEPMHIPADSPGPRNRGDLGRRVEFAFNVAGEGLERGFNPDKRVEPLYSTLDQRVETINKTGRETLVFSNEDDLGNSRCYPNLETAKGIILRDKMAEFKQRYVEFRNGIVNFSPFSKSEVKIESMTSDRIKNYKQAAEALSEQWNREAKGGKTDWKPEDVKIWMKANELVFHECSDMKTCQFVPRAIHEAVHHTGGRLECRIREGREGASLYDD